MCMYRIGETNARQIQCPLLCFCLFSSLVCKVHKKKMCCIFMEVNKMKCWTKKRQTEHDRRQNAINNITVCKHMIWIMLYVVVAYHFSFYLSSSLFLISLTLFEQSFYLYRISFIGTTQPYKLLINPSMVYFYNNFFFTIASYVHASLVLCLRCCTVQKLYINLVAILQQSVCKEIWIGT